MEEDTSVVYMTLQSMYVQWQWTLYGLILTQLGNLESIHPSIARLKQVVATP